MLLSLIQSGDQRAFRRLVDHYQRRLFGSALRYLHSEALAEETVQDIFLVVWVKRNTLPEIENFGAWLNSVSRNTIYAAFNKSLRAGETLTASSLIELPSVIQPADHVLLEKEYASILREAVDRLSPKQKMTWHLIREKGLKRDEAARELQVSPETVKYNLDEATRKIRAFCMVRLGYIPMVILLITGNRPG